MKLKDRIREAMEGAGLKPLQLARATKRSSGAVTQWIDGTTKSLKADTASALEKATGYRSDWIVTGKGEKKASAQSSATPQNQPTVAIGKWPAATDVVGLSPDALRLARWLDGMTDAEQRQYAWVECMNIIKSRSEKARRSAELRVDHTDETPSSESDDQPGGQQTEMRTGTDRRAQGQR